MASMEFHRLPIFVLFSLVLAAMAVGRSDILLPDKIALVTTKAERSDLSVPAEIYWHSKLPNTPIPQDLLNLIQQADTRPSYGRPYEQPFAEDTTDSQAWPYEQPFAEDTTDRRHKYGSHYEQPFAEDTTDRRHKYGSHYEQPFAEDTTDSQAWPYEQPFAEDTTDRRHKYGSHYEQPFAEDTTDRRHKYGSHYEQPFAEDTTNRRHKYGSHYGRRYELKFNKHALSNSTVFFLPNDLHAGKKMRVHITKSANKARILPRQVADSLPFSTNKLAEIMKRFSVNPESRQGKILKQTVEDCESPGIKGEDRFCPTSLESLVDFSVKHVGNKAQVLMNEIDKPKREQEYTIKEVKFIGENHVVCHKLQYPYAVYYCHALKGTKVYTAQVVGADGTKAKAVAVCHTDTSAWNPGHLAFLVLKMKPGEGTVCHFIRSDTFVMVSN
uniref:BURP domain-containing protein n=1 Tax=Manihot esculenta TaxID=3983 RepID=A0A2C9VRG5_MANES